MLRHNCIRCDQRIEGHQYAIQYRQEALRDMPYIFAGFCSAICQALNLRKFMIENGDFDPTGRGLTPKQVAAHEKESLLRVKYGV